MKWALRLLGIVVTLFVGVLLLAFTFLKIDKVHWDDVTPVQGKIAFVELSKNQDVVITMEGDQHQYYVNRGMEKNMDLDLLEIGTEVSICYVKVVPFKWNMIPLHIARIEVGEKVVYNEIQDEI